MRSLGQERRRSLLDQLLVATLDRAVTGGDDVEVSQRIARGLRLHVTGDLDEALDEVSTQVGCVRVASKEQVQVSLRADNADASATAAVGSLEHHGVTGRGDERLDLLARGHGFGHAGNRRNTAGLGHATSLDLVTQNINDVRGGTQPRDTSVLDGARKI